MTTITQAELRARVQHAEKHNSMRALAESQRRPHAAIIQAERDPHGAALLFTVARLVSVIEDFPYVVSLEDEDGSNATVALVRDDAGVWYFTNSHFGNDMRARMLLNISSAMGMNPVFCVPEFERLLRVEPSKVGAMLVELGDKVPGHAYKAALSMGSLLDDFSDTAPAPLNDVVEALLAAGLGIDDVPAPGFPNALNVAAHMGDFRNITVLLANGADPSIRCGSGNALRAAVSACRDEAVRLLISHSPPSPEEGGDLLHLAIEGLVYHDIDASLSIMEQLLIAGATKTQVDPVHGRTPAENLRRALTTLEEGGPFLHRRLSRAEVRAIENRCDALLSTGLRKDDQLEEVDRANIDDRPTYPAPSASRVAP